MGQAHRREWRKKKISKEKQDRKKCGERLRWKRGENSKSGEGNSTESGQKVFGLGSCWDARPGMGCPVCSLGLRSFVPVRLATAQSWDSPDETSLEKSCFSILLPQLSQQIHKRKVTHSATRTAHRHPSPEKLTGRRKESRSPLRIITPSPSRFLSLPFTPTLTHRSSSSLSGLLGIVLLDFAPLWWMICLEILSVCEQTQHPGGRTEATFLFLSLQVTHTLNICVYLWMCVCVCGNLQPFWAKWYVAWLNSWPSPPAQAIS